MVLILGATILQPYSATEGIVGSKEPAIDFSTKILIILIVLILSNVLILSGDHIYKMDYDDMLQTHKDNMASLTVAVIDVPL